MRLVQVELEVERPVADTVWIGVACPDDWSDERITDSLAAEDMETELYLAIIDNADGGEDEWAGLSVVGMEVDGDLMGDIDISFGEEVVE